MSIHGWSSVVHGLGPVHQRKLLGTNPCALETPTLAEGTAARRPSASNATTRRDAKSLKLLMVSRDTGVYTNGAEPKTKADTSDRRQAELVASGAGQQRATAKRSSSSVWQRVDMTNGSSWQANLSNNDIRQKANVIGSSSKQQEKMNEQLNQATGTICKRQSHRIASTICKQQYQAASKMCKRQYQTANEMCEQMNRATSKIYTGQQAHMMIKSNAAWQGANAEVAAGSARTVKNVVHILSYTAKATSSRVNKRELGKQQNCTINGTIEDMRKKMNSTTSGSKDAPLQQRQILRQEQERMTTGSMQQKANVFGNGSGRKQIQRATNNVSNDKTKERWQRVNPATSGSREEPSQQRQAQANSKIGNSKNANSANSKNEEIQIQRVANNVSNDKTKERWQRMNPATSGSGEEPLQQRQAQANSKMASSKNANSANSKNEEIQIQQEASAEINKEKERKMRQKEKATISTSMKRRLRQQQWQAENRCNKAGKRQRSKKFGKQNTNAETGGGEHRQKWQAKNLKIGRSRRKQLQQKQVASECSNQKHKGKSKPEQQVNSKKKAGNVQTRHAAAIRSKQMAYQATVSAKCRRQAAKAIKQIRASTTRSTVRIRKGARLSTAPDGKAQKRYYHPIIELRAALCAILLAKNLLSLVMGWEFSKWDADENDGITSGTLTRLR